MQEDFHYYATYAAAYLAGYSHEESKEISYSAQFVDMCTATLLKGIKAPVTAATTQLQMEMADTRIDPVAIQNITRIWSSFHFLPYDLYAEPPKGGSKRYKNRYRLICGPNGDLLVDTVELAKGRGLQAAGIAMHILADTWAHRYFAGTPSLVINNTNFQFCEVVEGKDRPIKFSNNPKLPDDPERGIYVNSLYQESETSIMNLGHGRAGHLPDYSFAVYRYVPAWNDYNEIIKDNPAEYVKAFSQMVYALRYLRGDYDVFEKDHYEDELLAEYMDEIKEIIGKRQLNACAEWKNFGEKLSGEEIPDFDIERYRQEYLSASEEERDNTAPGQFFIAALAQKSMVTNRIFKSGNMVAGFSVNFNENGFRGMRDYAKLIEHRKERVDD